ncbi:C6 zinc finger domain protein [Stagonosporopsis vannaccii]|nr:C6 zinc finger domain protein [Stagonosporopsis vannaccii]
MVGVPGRSKGCVTCRKRKKGCDLKRPACGQCCERNIKCGGYDTDRVFITSKYASPSTIVKRPAESPVLTKDLVAVTACTYQTIPESFAQSAFNAKGMEAAFELFPVQGSGGALSTKIQFSTLLPALTMGDEALRQMVFAVGLVTLGKGSNNEVILRKGRTMYGKALHELGSSLQNPRKQTIEALLATTRLMGLYEILYGADGEDMTQARNWLSHAQGEIALVVSRGPDAFTSDAAHLMFTLARYNCAITGIRSRRAVVFNEEQWKTVPWRGRVKLASDSIIDILLELPTILENLDYLDRVPLTEPCFEELRLEAATKCWAIHCRLTAWFAENSYEVYTPDIEAPIPFDFPNLSVATLSIRYWATATILYQSLDRALRYSAYESLPPYLNRPHGRPFARLIVRSVSGLFKRDHGVAGPSAVLFPLGIALMYLRQSEVPDTEYLNLVFAVWNDPDWPRSIKTFLKSMSRSINLPTRVLSDNPGTWSTSELRPMYDIDGNVLSGPYLKPSRFLSV